MNLAVNFHQSSCGPSGASPVIRHWRLSLSPCFRIARLFAVGLLCASQVYASDWLQFRGPNMSGIADGENYATTWSATENVVWRTELPGPGSSSPIVVGDKVFVTCFRGVSKNSSDLSRLERILLCVDRNDGKILWQNVVKGVANEDRFQGFIQGHGYTTSTPISDGERVYVFFGKAGVIACDLDGNQLWQTSVGTGSAKMGWGQGASLILYRDLLIVPAFAECQAMVALNKYSGSRVWKSAAEGFDGSWCSPTLVDLPDGKQELVVSVPFEIWAYDPANGDFLWFAEGIKEGVIGPTLVSKDGVVYAIGGRLGAAVAIRAGGRGDVTKSHTVWRKAFGSYVPSPVLLDDHLYWVSDKAIAFCVKTADGDQVYRERIGDAGELYSSVVAANGSLFAVSRENGTFVYPAKPQFESAVRNVVDADAGTCNATPAFSNGLMFLRTSRYLYGIGRK